MLLVLIIAAALGLTNTVYLLWKRYGSRTPLICPFGQSCELVLNSRYGRAIGFRNEIIGAAYYAAVFILLVMAGQAPTPIPLEAGLVWGQGIEPLLLAFYLSVPALGASVILTVIQTFVLRNYCSWCLLANAVNVFLFLGLFYLAR